MLSLNSNGRPSMPWMLNEMCTYRREPSGNWKPASYVLVLKSISVSLKASLSMGRLLFRSWSQFSKRIIGQLNPLFSLKMYSPFSNCLQKSLIASWFSSGLRSKFLSNTGTPVIVRFQKLVSVNWCSWDSMPK